MKPADTSQRHEIKQLLTEATFWCQSGDLDLAVEKIQAVIDRERVKAQLAEVPTPHHGLRDD